MNALALCSTKRIGKTILALHMAAALSVFAGAESRAGASDEGALRQRFNAAFEAMLNDPSDVTLTTRYAEAAVELGDYESAIPPLERLLMQDMDQPGVRLEVGVLYFLLRSHGMAKSYLNEVKSSGKATPEQVKRAEEYLAKM